MKWSETFTITEKGYVLDGGLVIDKHQGFLTKDQKRLYLFENKQDVLENIQYQKDKALGILEYMQGSGKDHARMQLLMYNIHTSIQILLENKTFIRIDDYPGLNKNTGIRASQ